MDKVFTLFNELKLFYYEYDKSHNKFIKDKNSNKDASYNEFIRLTSELSKNEIEFFVDNNSDIIISQKDHMIERLKHKFKTFKTTLKNRKKNIYILSEKDVKHAKNLPLIKTEVACSSVELDKYDALVFTSKNGVTHLNSINNEWKNIPAYAISTQTAKQIKELGGKLAFIGTKKHGNEFAHELIDKLESKKVAYVGAKKVVSDLTNILNQNNIACDHLGIYETICIEYDEKVDLPDDSIIIFSSPSTIKYFFKNVNWKDTFKAISIGNTTKNYFPDYVEPIVADNTTLQSCTQKALSLQ